MGASKSSLRGGCLSQEDVNQMRTYLFFANNTMKQTVRKLIKERETATNFAEVALIDRRIQELIWNVSGVGIANAEGIKNKPDSLVAGPLAAYCKNSTIIHIPDDALRQAPEFQCTPTSNTEYEKTCYNPVVQRVIRDPASRLIQIDAVPKFPK